MPLMSSSKLGKCSSARFRPRAEKASIQIIPLSSSCIPLRMVSRSQPNSRSAFRCPPLPSAFTALAMNSRRALPLNSLAVSIKSDLTSGVSSICPSQILCLCVHPIISGRIYFLQVPYMSRALRFATHFTHLQTGSPRKLASGWKPTLRCCLISGRPSPHPFGRGRAPISATTSW